MTEDKSYPVGRGRPPPHSRWKKGQTGNPHRIRRRKGLDAAKMVEAAFRKRIYVTEQNERRRVTVFEAIVLQLWSRAVKQNGPAIRVFLQYQDFAVGQGELGGIEVRVRNESDDEDPSSL
jgi:hypothetical protein